MVEELGSHSGTPPDAVADGTPRTGDAPRADGPALPAAGIGSALPAVLPTPGAPDSVTPSPGASPEGAEPDWAAIRTAYEAGVDSLPEISRTYGITTSAISWRARRQLWAPRYRTTTVDRPLIITRLFRLLERQIIELEKNMKETGEKEVAVLGKLVSTLEKLIDIDKAASPPKPVAQQKDIRDLRNKLAQRIAQLKRV